MVCYSRLFLFIATEQQLPVSMMANLLMWHYRNLFKSSSKWVLSLTRSTVKSISNISVLMTLDALITRESMTGSRAKVKARSRRNCVCVCVSPDLSISCTRLLDKHAFRNAASKKFSFNALLFQWISNVPWSYYRLVNRKNYTLNLLTPSHTFRITENTT